MKNNNEISRQEQEILDYITSYMLKHGYVPTIREMCDGVGYGSTSTIQKYLQRMLSKGIIESDLDKLNARGFRIPGYKIIKEN